ncbi:MAG: DUF3990 domain-containing protein [Fibromonadaceae bacterium]|jgi:hypothetical protein|nr:DUF3990 domain-containing protein [Fibromonadaceae bacterium]
MKILFHGSSKIVDCPQFGKGNLRNDYGLGFYCTENLELAREWACSNIRGGYANKYSLDLAKMEVLNLSAKEYNILNWISLLLNNRTFSVNNQVASEGKEYLIQNFMPNTNDFDVIIGYRADDSYFAFAQDFLNNAISVKTLVRTMKLGNLGEQVVMKSKKAFEALSFENAEPVDGSLYFGKRQERDVQARDDYLKKEKFNKMDSDDFFLIDILRRQIKQNDIEF